MKCVYLVIAVFCVVPCAFQDVWDEYETWYDDMDDFNNLENDELVGKLDKPEDSDLPDPVQGNDENKDDDYYMNGNNNDYGDYEIEDNRDEVKPKIEDQEVNQEQELEKNDESAMEDFDTLQKIINNDDTINEAIVDKILAVDEKSQMDLNDLLPEDIKDDKMVEQNVDVGDGGIQQNIDDINQETQQILENINSAFDEDNVDNKNEPDVEVQKENQDIIEETRQILEETNKDFDENKEEQQDFDNQDDALLERQNEQLKDVENSPDALYDDNNPDLEKLLDTWKKISPENDDDEPNTNVENLGKAENKNEQIILEEPNADDDFGRDNAEIEDRINSNEDTVDKVYEDLNADLDKLFETWQKLSVDGDEIKTNEENVESVENKNEQVIPEEANIDDNNDSKAINEEGIQSMPDIQADMQDIIEETRQILEETNKEFDEIEEEKQELVKGSDQDAVILEGQNEDAKDAENSPDQLYDDNNPDLEKLLETWKKLRTENDDDEPNVENQEEAENKNEQILLEESIADNVEIGDEVKEQNNFDYEGESRILQMRNDYYDSILDKDLANIFKEFDDVEQNADTDSEESVQILYVNDALVADSDDNNPQDTDNLEDNKKSDANAVEVELKLDNVPENGPTITKDEDDFLVNPENPIQQSSEEKSAKLTKNVDELNNNELDELNKQFVILHSSDMINDNDETPIHITLNADEPVVVTSPNYPSAYPTDISTIDWILEGQGTGLEVNVTDLDINSAMGHYLLLKPGQSDASGDDGIVFAYRLNNERRYRFRDVNKMLVRFNPAGGMSFSRGFKLSAKIIEAPVSDDGNVDDLPEPEALLPEPHETATLLLAGANSTSFEDIREEFRRLLADMATLYINSNDIDPGMNDTNFVTQITRTYVCNVNWPDFNSCVSVTFGVPLVYEDGVTRLTERDLMEMWESFSGRDPFAARLTNMGITDYMPPKDNYIITVWVVIGVAVLISAAMLALVLWRYSCIENYTRMVDYNETDSFQEKKRGLDMYPTPHQTLPPLFTENDYKWADRTFDDDTRVDMGGFTNNTFTRDELSDESEDEAAKRDRNSFQPRDFSAA